jgi:hypothetical protein
MDSDGAPRLSIAQKDGKVIWQAPEKQEEGK